MREAIGADELGNPTGDRVVLSAYVTEAMSSEALEARGASTKEM
jgi:hypothetical protein